MTFREIRNSKGLTIKFVIEQLSEKGIQLTDWQLNNRETNPKRFEPREIKALCDIYQVDFNKVDF